MVDVITLTMGLLIAVEAQTTAQMERGLGPGQISAVVHVRKFAGPAKLFYWKLRFYPEISTTPV
jgi:hypothetical protein